MLFAICAVLGGGWVLGLCLHAFFVGRNARALERTVARRGATVSAYRGDVAVGGDDANGASRRAARAFSVAAFGLLAFSFLVPVEWLADRAAAWLARGMSKREARPLPFLPAWRVAFALRRRDGAAIDMAERHHRLQIVANVVLTSALFVLSPLWRESPAAFATLAAMLVARGLHTRLLGQLAKRGELPRATHGELGLARQGAREASEPVPPWLASALTRRAESRFGVPRAESARRVSQAAEGATSARVLLPTRIATIPATRTSSDSRAEGAPVAAHSPNAIDAPPSDPLGVLDEPMDHTEPDASAKRMRARS